MRTIQEQEGLDYQMGAASEYQNAFAWSRMNRKPDDSDKINKAIQEGKYVVVSESPEYCPSTDASMGTRRDLCSVHDDRESAERAASLVQRTPDDWVYVLPVQRVEQPETVLIVLFDIPF